MAISVPYTFYPNTVIQSSQVNADFQAVVNGINAVPTPVSLQAFRNRLINGNMVIDQRNNGVAQSAIANNTFVVDRWVYGATQSGKFNAGQYNINGPSGQAYSMFLTSTGSTPVGSTDYFVIGQKIEGLNIQDLSFGTGFAQSVSLSFWVWCSLSGTFGGSLENGASGRSYVFTYLIPAPSVWTFITIPNIPGDITGSWTIDNSVGMYLLLSLGAGSIYQTTPGSWQTGNFVTTNTATNVVSTNAAIIYFTGVQLEPGSVCTSFETRLNGVELGLCQRYYQYSNPPGSDYGGGLFFSGSVVGTSVYFAQVKFGVPMRATPTVTLLNGQSTLGFSATSGTVNSQTKFGAQEARTANATIGASWFFSDFTASAEL